jgi:RNA polymerase sigma-70 factor, ECF subfamily
MAPAASHKVSITATASILVPPVSAAPIDLTIRAAQRGDQAAFARLYDQHAPRVHALCLGLTGDRAEAAELVQDVFVRAWQHLDSFRGDSAFGTWIHRIAVNAALASRRSSARRTLRVAIAADLVGDTDGATDTLGDVSAPSHDPGDAIDLEAAILRLPAAARAVFVLYEIEGYQHTEIGEKLSIAEGTSKAHLFRARRLLREMLSR